MACGEGGKWAGAALQDEETCIGCTMCASIAPGTFRIEKDHGRSRVFAQWANTDDETQVRASAAAAPPPPPPAGLLARAEQVQSNLLCGLRMAVADTAH